VEGNGQGRARTLSLAGSVGVHPGRVCSEHDGQPGLVDVEDRRRDALAVARADTDVAVNLDGRSGRCGSAAHESEPGDDGAVAGIAEVLIDAARSEALPSR
jgi:hypothetical protein